MRVQTLSHPISPASLWHYGKKGVVGVERGDGAKLQILISLPAVPASLLLSANVDFLLQ